MFCQERPNKPFTYEILWDIELTFVQEVLHTLTMKCQ